MKRVGGGLDFYSHKSFEKMRDSLGDEFNMRRLQRVCAKENNETVVVWDIKDQINHWA
jgi:hypothetical protein